MQSSTISHAYTDFDGLAELRAQSRVDPQSTLEQVAKQFEGIFIQMMLKSMRDASMGDDIFDSDQSELYRDMFDKQISLDMANSKGIGIADSLIRQLGKNMPNKSDAEIKDLSIKTQTESLPHGKLLPLPERKMTAVIQGDLKGLSKFELSEMMPFRDKSKFNSAKDFSQHILPYAQKAAKELGVSPLVLISQAALETGWGKAVTRHADGSSSYNLFNIKADNRWDGNIVVKSTLEYHNGMAKYEKASFRSYDSYADSFDDYVDFLRSNSRYDDALRHQTDKTDDQLFIKDLHKAGYATDPDYADKIINILERDSMKISAINTLRNEKAS